MSFLIPVYKLRLVRDGSRSYPAPFADSSEASATFFSNWIGKADREHFAVLFLDARNRPTGANVISIGTLTETHVHPREVFKGAFLANANKIIIAHNHPAGAPIPSAGDLHLTTVLVRAGKLLGIPVVDHLIVSPDGSYFSLHQANLMGERTLNETMNS